MAKTRRRWALALAGLALAMAGTARAGEEHDAAPPELPAFRAVWISRFNWKSPQEIPAMFERAEAAGFNAVFFQVRGAGEAFYLSGLEPVPMRLMAAGEFDDPLGHAVREARARGMEIHAWMNCLSGWQGTEPPASPKHLWNRHPEWFMSERRPGSGAPADPMAFRPALEEGYTFLNPAVPGVREHLAGLAAELAKNYDIDGICLDYIRYKSERHSFDRYSLDAFGKDPVIDAPAWRQFRRDQINATVEGISAAALAEKPGLRLSAAVWGDYETGRERYAQDSRAWLSRGWVDFLCPMLYFVDPAVFEARMDDFANDARGRAVVPAVGAYLLKGEGGLLAEQLEAVARRSPYGYSFYEYGALFGGKKPSDEAALLAALKDFQPAKAPAIPPLEWVERRAAGDDDTAGPWFEQLSSALPNIEAGKPFRVGGLASDPSGLYVGPDERLAPRLEIARQADFSDAEAWPLTPTARGENPLKALYIPAEARQAPPAGQAVHVRAIAWDADADDIDGDDSDRVPDGDRARATSQVLRYRPVTAPEEFRFGGFFSSVPLPGPRSIAIVPPNQLWVSCADNDSVMAFGRTGDQRPFSPIREGLGPDGEKVAIRNPSTVAADPANGDALVACEHPDGLMILRFAKSGRAKPGLLLPVKGSGFALDARGQIYVCEPTRRRWHVFSPDGSRLGGPFGPFAQDDPRADSPCLQSGIAASPDGRRVYVASTTTRTLDLYELANAPEEGEGIVYLDEPAFAYRPDASREIGPLSMGVALAPDGRVFACDSDDRLSVYSPDLKEHRYDLWSATPPMPRPAGAAFFPTGKAFFLILHGGDSHSPSLHLWREKSEFDPPEGRRPPGESDPDDEPASR